MCCWYHHRKSIVKHRSLPVGPVISMGMHHRRLELDIVEVCRQVRPLRCWLICDLLLESFFDPAQVLDVIGVPTKRCACQIFERGSAILKFCHCHHCGSPITTRSHTLRQWDPLVHILISQSRETTGWPQGWKAHHPWDPKALASHCWLPRKQPPPL